MTVYVDVLVSLNIIVNYFLLLAAKAILRSDAKRGRPAFAAVIGGLYSLTIFIEGLPEYAAVIMKLAASAVIVLAAFGKGSFKLFIKRYAAFFAVNFAFAGLMLALWLTLSPPNMFYSGSVVYFDIDIKTLIISSVVCYAVITGITYLVGKNSARGKLYGVTLTNNGRSVVTRALLDTGNCVRDGFTGKPVVIADKSVTRRLADESLRAFLDGSAEETEIKEKIRLVPYKTVGRGGVLRAFVIDEMKIHKENITVRGVLLAEAQSPIGDGSYSVLLNSDIFESSEKREVLKK